MRIRPAIAALVTTLALAGCANDQPAATDQGYNDADVAFATDMIQHHAQALSMVDLTMGRDLDPALSSLAEEIRAAQAPEIEKMVDWLGDWDQPVPETVRDHANAHGDGHGEDGPESDVPGMMTADDMAALEGATGAEFERMWLSMMVEHHEGAIEMAEAELDEGASKPALKLARSIIADQQSEIATMQEMLDE